MDRWEQYLFETHSEETLRSWARRLQFFRFIRAHGGHANDGDSLEVAFRYHTLRELERMLAMLDVLLERYKACPPQPEPGVSYPMEDFERFPSLIPGTNWVRQPGHTVVGGHSVFIWCERDRVTMSLFEGYEVTEANVVAAEAIEKMLANVTLERIDPPRDSRNTICPKYFPDYFA
ncbi:MAG: hypothetical protein K1X67_21490 [Fimbriimonadaceae bacterium]|nr:hypothetical protein [Fimbriimonadaceae bacterium]